MDEWAFLIACVCVSYMKKFSHTFIIICPGFEIIWKRPLSLHMLVRCGIKYSCPFEIVCNERVRVGLALTSFFGDL